MRRLLALLILASVMALGLIAATSARAQAGPSEATLDAVFQDLSRRVGRTVTWRRGLLGEYSWQEVISNNDNLGCETPGAAAPGVTRAWEINVSLYELGTYNYRTTFDGSVILFCRGTGVGADAGGVITPVPPTPTPIPPPPPVTTAPTTYSAPILAYRNASGDVAIFGLGASTGPTAITGDARGAVSPDFFSWQAERFYDNLQWSPDGARLAFQDSGGLYVVESNAAPVQVAGGIYGLLPAAWSPDGSEIAYPVDTRQTAPDDPLATLVQVQAVPAAGGSPRVAGTISHGTGCGGGGRSPAQQVYEREAGYEGNRQVMFWTAQGFVHTKNCTGIGIALADPSGRRLWELADVARPALSPDRSRIAAIRMGNVPGGAPTPAGIVVVDVATGQTTPLNVSGVPEQLAWSADGQSVYYTTRTPGRTVPMQANAGLPDFYPAEATVYAVELWSVPVAGGAPVQLWTGGGYAIARISASSTAAVVAFTLIQDESALYQAAVPGANPSALAAAAPQPQIGVASLTPNAPGYPFLLQGAAGSPVFGSAQQFTAVPAEQTAPALPTGDNPLGLQIGGRASVTSDTNVNVRLEPKLAPGNVLTLLRPGDTVTILSGPVSADNLRWWQVRRDSDGATGWVADQVSDAQGVTNNLAPLQ